MANWWNEEEYAVDINEEDYLISIESVDHSITTHAKYEMRDASSDINNNNNDGVMVMESGQRTSRLAPAS